MKIILGIDHISRINTGISTLVENLCNEFIKDGHSVYIAAIEDKYSHHDKEKFDHAELVLLKNGSGPLNLYRTFTRYYRFYSDSNADIANIHSFWSVSTIAIYLWALKYRKPYIISANGMLNSWALSQSKLKKQLFSAVIFKKIITKANAIIVNSIAEKSYFQKKTWNQNLYVIPNGVSIPVVSLNIKNKSPVKKLLFLSRIHKKKGIEMLLSAWSELYDATKQNDWELLIVGFSDIENNTYEKHIAHRIQTDFRLSNVDISNGKFGDEMWQQYHSCDAFILPTFSEGSAMAVLNAWAAGKICLTTIGSNLEAGLDNQCTILIEPTIGSIKAGILKLMNLNTEQLSSLGQIGRKVVQDNYSWQKIASNHIEVYQDAVY